MPEDTLAADLAAVPFSPYPGFHLFKVVTPSELEQATRDGWVLLDVLGAMRMRPQFDGSGTINVNGGGTLTRNNGYANNGYGSYDPNQMGNVGISMQGMISSSRMAPVLEFSFVVGRPDKNVLVEYKDKAEKAQATAAELEKTLTQTKKDFDAERYEANCQLRTAKELSDNLRVLLDEEKALCAKSTATLKDVTEAKTKLEADWKKVAAFLGEKMIKDILSEEGQPCGESSSKT